MAKKGTCGSKERFVLPLHNLSILQNRAVVGDYFQFLDCTSDEDVHWELKKATKTGSAGSGETLELRHEDLGKERRLTSNADTFIHLVKGNIGTGILAMPLSFKNAGLITATLGTVAIGVCCVYTMHILIAVSKKLQERYKNPPLNFGDVAAASFRIGPPVLHKYADSAKIITNVFLYLTQLGICCVYLVFVADNLHEVLKAYYSVDVGVKTCMTLLLIPVLSLSWIRDLKNLVPLMILADIITAVGLIIILCFTFQDLPPIVERQIFFTSWHQLALFFSTTIFAFEGIAMILPLQNSMKNPEDFAGYNGVLNKSMAVVLFAYVTVGFFGYLKYGDKVKGSITLNLESSMWAEYVRLMMALAIFLSYALQFYVPIDLTRSLLKQYISNHRAIIVAELAYRTLLVFVIFLLAETVSDLGLFISLVGALTSTTLSFVFPPVFNILVNWSDGYGSYSWMLWKDTGIILFGIGTCVGGTYISSVAIQGA